MCSQFEGSPSSKQLVLIEEVLREHPGVRAARAFKHAGQDGDTVVQIVPDDEYLARVLAGNEEERKRIQTWRKTFDLMQMGKEAAAAEPGFNIAGWNSSYTRQPIPAPDMREWVTNTVTEIASFKPQEVLEIGCGTGLLLLRIAPQCKRYTGTDFAPAVLGKLRKQLDVMPGSWDGVTLLERSADNFEGFAENTFDTIVINSVVQHFPSVSYLIKVLEGASRVLRPGGRIFIGDIRSLPLLEAYCVSVEFYQAGDEVGLMELRERVVRRLNLQDQLVISPAFFLAFGERNVKISDVEIRVKRGRLQNELTRYRYSAVLHARSQGHTRKAVQWTEWSHLQHGRAEIQRVLREKQPETFAVSGVPNARVEEDLRAMSQVFERNAQRTVGELKIQLNGKEPKGIDPELFHEDAATAGYRVDLSWAGCQADGSYDAVFSRIVPGGQEAAAILWPELSTAGVELSSYVNVPGRITLRQRLVRELQDYCRQQAAEVFKSCTVNLVDSFVEPES